MCKRLFLIFFLAQSLSAAKRENYEASLGVGYRRDHLQTAFSQGGAQTYKENDSTLQGMAVTASLESKAKNVVWNLSGDAGSYFSGLSTTNFGSQNAKGFFGDGILSFGYNFMISSSRTSSYRFVPHTGYSAFYQELKYLDASSTFDLTHTNLRRLWQGPFLGGILDLRPLANWGLEVGYDWYWFYFAQSIEPFFVDDTTYTWKKMQAHFFGAHGQRFSGKLLGKLARRCWGSLFCEVLSFITPKGSADERQKQQIGSDITVTKSSGQMKAWTHSLLVGMEIEYFF